MTDAEIYIPPADPYPDLPYHVKYAFVCGSEIGRARCAHCGERWERRPSGEDFETWYREHAACLDPEVLSSSTSG